MMAMFQGNSWVEASVQLRSGHEAVRARDALHLHGRNIKRRPLQNLHRVYTHAGPLPFLCRAKLQC